MFNRSVLVSRPISSISYLVYTRRNAAKCERFCAGMEQIWLLNYRESLSSSWVDVLVCLISGKLNDVDCMLLLESVDKRSKSQTGISRHTKPMFGFTTKNKHICHFFIFSYRQFRSYPKKKKIMFQIYFIASVHWKVSTSYFKRKRQASN